MRRHDTLVIGAGPAGLAAAAMLQRVGVPALVVDRARCVASTWRSYYDRLELQSPRWLTSLPGHRFPAEAGRWPDRDAVVTYLERYAAQHRLQVLLDTEVHRLDCCDGEWLVRTSRGPLCAREVVVATGYNRVPLIPDWPGVATFTGELIHAGAFRNGDPYRGRDVLVVGGGNSGSEIAAILADEGARRVFLSVRTAPHVVPRQAFGVPALLGAVMTRHLPPRLADVMLGGFIRLTVGDQRSFGMPPPLDGVYTQYLKTQVTPILDHGIVDLLRTGRVTIVAAVDHFDGDDVVLADRSRVSPNVVIAATGYLRGLEPLVGHLGVLQADGRPRVHGDRTHPNAPGLYFIGFTHPFSGNIREVAIDSRRIARAVERERFGRFARTRRALRAIARRPREAVREGAHPTPIARDASLLSLDGDPLAAAAAGKRSANGAAERVEVERTGREVEAAATGSSEEWR
jgi:putative flavoprotein involved in K+ transport